MKPNVEACSACPLSEFKRISNQKMSKKLTVLFFSDTLMDYKSVIDYLNQLENSFFLTEVIEFTTIISNNNQESKTTRIKVIDAEKDPKAISLEVINLVENL